MQSELQELIKNNNIKKELDEAQLIMCQVACKWAGVPLRNNEVKKRATDLGKMIDGFGAVGIRYWQGRYARKQSEKWIRDIVRPMFAIATYITFGALAMYENPECKQKLRAGNKEYNQMFVQETRRFTHLSHM